MVNILMFLTCLIILLNCYKKLLLLNRILSSYLMLLSLNILLFKSMLMILALINGRLFLVFLSLFLSLILLLRKVIRLNRNTPAFDNNPINLDISRSTFKRNSSVKTSFNVGQVIPFYLDEVLPGDTFNIQTSKVVRLQTMLSPVMDNIYLDTYYFFVPNRLLWEHWKQFNGENTSTHWTPSTTYQIPQITSPASTGWLTGSLADYLGIPINIPNLSVSALPFRAYSLIMNDWFRDENLMDPLNISITDSTVAGLNYVSGDFVNEIPKGAFPFLASKYRDYFTSCLPAPQKGVDVSLGLLGEASVYGNGKTLSLSDGTSNYGLESVLNNNGMLSASSSLLGSTVGSAPTVPPASINKSLGLLTKSQLGAIPSNSGVVADLTSASAISINALRLAFQIQRLYEKDARGGSRYIEILKAHFGVTSPDARQQRPEYLGGNRVPINVNQVVQQSMSSGTEPLGELGAYSLTTDSNSDFVKSFTEHGFVMGLMVARYDHTYQQGIERFWSRKDRFDYYWPALANIGEQSVKNKEIYAQGTSADNEVFGYQEAWADYRYKPSRVSGFMRSTSSKPLDVWHLGDKYTTLPTLSATWIREDATNVDRVLAVTSSVSSQLFADLFIMNKTTRPLPLYSIPGLTDHH